ncbi:MAG: hypothetical protein QOI25_3306, partial [Mycobacterium sp.]|nr:hypothetical protein [Mycobacterium sp.]
MTVSGTRSPISRAAYNRDHERDRGRNPPPTNQRNSARRFDPGGHPN